MDEYSNLLIFFAVIIAFIAGYAIISFLIRFFMKKAKDLQLPPLNNENMLANKKDCEIDHKDTDSRFPRSRE